MICRMKRLFYIALLLLPTAAFAQLVPLQAKPADTVQVIDGKKFFSLQNVRRLPSSSGSTLSPSAIAVMNHPRVDSRIPLPNRLAMTPVPAPSAAPPATKADNIKNELLSIFAPDDRAARIPATK